MGQQTRPNPYPYGNFALTLDFLEELISIVSKEKGLVAIPESAGGYEDIVYDDFIAASLNPPDEAVSATIMVENLSGSSTEPLIRFKENGTDPTTTSGFPLSHGDIFELIGYDNLRTFRALNLNDDIAIRVQYYRSAKNLPETPVNETNDDGDVPPGGGLGVGIGG
ncbi:MAG: hypothetical protein JXQ90_18360 [Cyclobacteriaceae bacterium]